MRYVAAYLLANLGGNASPSAADIEKILSSVGIEADKEKLKKVRFIQMISRLEYFPSLRMFGNECCVIGHDAHL